MAKYLLSFYIVWYPAYLEAQSQEADPSAYGPGPIVSTAGNPWALFRNMAGLVQADKSHLILSYQFPYNLPELQKIAIGLILPWKPIIGLSLFQSGTGSLINQQFSLNTALTVSGISVGLRIKYWHLNFTGFRNLNLVSVSTGIQTNLTEQLQLGIFIGNVSQSRIDGQEALSITCYTGLKYQPISKLDLHFETGYRQDGYRWEAKLGVKYQIKNKLSLSTGFNGSTYQGHLGVGFCAGPLNVDYALTAHPYLGISHQAALNYGWP